MISMQLRTFYFQHPQMVSSRLANLLFKAVVFLGPWVGHWKCNERPAARKFGALETLESICQQAISHLFSVSTCLAEEPPTTKKS